MALKKLGISPVMLAFIIGLIVASCYTVLFTLEDEAEAEELERQDKSYAEATHTSHHPIRGEKGRQSQAGEADSLRDGE